MDKPAWLDQTLPAATKHENPDQVPSGYRAGPSSKLSALFKALSDWNRLRIVAALLKYDELCACQLTELIQVAGATASRHMGVLIASGLVGSRKEGRFVYYRIRREQADVSLLLGWIESQLSGDKEISFDTKRLDEITSYEPEDLCRKQRGAECCPRK